ncbi:MAG: aromatic amino acid transport family protein [Chlamydiota bacterium]|nr:aromatic amino acid transport family protein [Chlamydiota bacterium]
MKIANYREKGSVLGSILLIAGSCVGAGMLGLPVSTAMGGFQPSVVMFFVCWLFMMVSSLFLLEVNLYFKKEVNLITMADKTLGRVGQFATWVLFLFLFYSLMVSYSAGSGELVADFVEEFTGFAIARSLGSIIAVSLFGVVIYYGTFAVDQLNRILMVGLIVTFFMLLYFGAPSVNKKLLNHVNWFDSIWALPVMVISFGYHNLVPSLTTYLEFNAKRMRISIIIGSAIPLVGYILWEWLILGLIPYDNFLGALDQGNMVTHTLRQVVGKSWVVEVAQYFAFFAIVTSFIGVALSFVDFLADGFGIEKNRRGSFLLCCMALGPPLFFALLYPSLFIVALKYAGGFGANILFGVLPALMVWSGRYYHKLWDEEQVPGGKVTLALITFFAVAIFGVQLVNALYFNR